MVGADFFAREPSDEVGEGFPFGVVWVFGFDLWAGFGGWGGGVASPWEEDGDVGFPGGFELLLDVWG